MELKISRFTVRHHIKSIERKWRVVGSREIATAKLKLQVAQLTQELADMAQKSLAQTRQYRRRRRRGKLAP